LEEGQPNSFWPAEFPRDKRPSPPNPFTHSILSWRLQAKGSEGRGLYEEPADQLVTMETGPISQRRALLGWAKVGRRKTKGNQRTPVEGEKDPKCPPWEKIGRGKVRA
jgi:hypothetical protein